MREQASYVKRNITISSVRTAPKMISRTPPDSGKYAFITSTPFYSAKGKNETKTLVRKHVMRPFTKQNRPKRANGLKNIAPRASVDTSQQQLPAPITNEEAREPETEYGSPMSSQTIFMVLLGSGRVNPFQAWPIKMDMQEHELVHHSESYHVKLVLLLTHRQSGIHHKASNHSETFGSRLVPMTLQECI